MVSIKETMTLFQYLRSLSVPNSFNSSKSFVLTFTGIIGCILALLLGISLLIDVIKDGKVDSDFIGAAIYLVSIGSFIWMGGQNKVQGDKYSEFARLHSKDSLNNSNTTEPKTTKEDSSDE